MNKDFGALPTVEDLAERTKAATVTMSLRVKETTKKFFEWQAQRLQGGAIEGGEEKRLTASALMNGLLDDYAENYETRTRGAGADRSIEMMWQALQKMARTVARADDEALLRRVMRNPNSGELRDNLMEITNYYDDADAAYESFEIMKRGEDFEGAELRYMLDDGDIIVCDPSGSGEEGAKYDDSLDWQVVTLSPEKWIVVVAMTDCFVRKLHGLCPECSASLSVNVMRKLARLAAETDDRVELAKKVAGFYADYTEQLNG